MKNKAGRNRIKGWFVPAFLLNIAYTEHISVAIYRDKLDHTDCNTRLKKLKTPNF